jgi:hypothetical protein
MSTIDIDQLQKTIAFLLSELKNRRGNLIELKNDYYWDFDDKELYDVTKDPKDFSIGQLSFDWERINGKDKNDLTPYSITNISHILKAISIENPIAF